MGRLGHHRSVVMGRDFARVGARVARVVNFTRVTPRAVSFYVSRCVKSGCVCDSTLYKDATATASASTMTAFLALALLLDRLAQPALGSLLHALGRNGICGLADCCGRCRPARCYRREGFCPAHSHHVFLNQREERQEGEVVRQSIKSCKYVCRLLLTTKLGVTAPVPMTLNGSRSVL